MIRVLPFLALVTACTAYDSDIGPTPYLCGETEPRCPEGYACQDDITTGEQVCVGGGGSLATDFDCADDSSVEPNNMLADATDSGVAASAEFTREGLAICPAGDKDLFAITITGESTNVELVIDRQRNGAELAGAILNAGGIPIATAAAVSGDPERIRASAQNLPPGMYYAQVAAAPGALTLNNYAITVTVP